VGGKVAIGRKKREKREKRKREKGKIKISK